MSLLNALEKEKHTSPHALAVWTVYAVEAFRDIFRGVSLSLLSTDFEIFFAVHTPYVVRA